MSNADAEATNVPCEACGEMVRVGDLVQFKGRSPLFIASTHLGMPVVFAPTLEEFQARWIAVHDRCM